MTNATTLKVNDLHSHMVTAIESSHSWFDYSDCVMTPDGDGYVSARVTLFDEEDVFMSPTEETRARILQKMAAAVCPVTSFPFTMPEGWDAEGRPYWTLTHSLFLLGLARVREEVGDLQCIVSQGKGEWDIDADGADLIVQYALFGGTIFG